MYAMTHRARPRAHLSRRERQQLARLQAFSRRTPRTMPAMRPVKLRQEQLELIDRLVQRDRTPVSMAVLAIAGIGSGEARRQVVLERVREAARRAEAEGAITRRRRQGIARHVQRAIRQADVRITA
jgi:hypothetical protein